jgi:hypothetical protein
VASQTRAPKPGADPNLKARAEGRVYTPEEIGQKMDRLEIRMAQLRNRYEQFFIGLERKPPHPEREAIRKELEQFKNVNIANTSVRFRYNSVWNRFLAYERMWLRTIRDIEEGRYSKDLFKLRLHRRGGRDAAEDIDTSSFDDEAQETGSTAPAATRPEGRGPSDERLRALYAAYLAAKQECRQSTDGMTFEAMASQLRGKVPDLLEQTKAREIDFKVVIKDGKAALRAVAKSE